jgi:protein O-GlcNAc transferase
MSLAPEQVDAAIRQARDFLDQERVGAADLACQSLVDRGVVSSEVILLLGQIAGRIGEFAAARKFLEQCRATFPAPAADGIAELNRLEAAHQSAARAINCPRKFHLIKAWGFGFTSDLDHTLGHLLLAEMSSRIPVIHWGQNSLFRDANEENAWTQFFEPVSPFSIGDLTRVGYSFYPDKWSAGNLRREEMNKLEGPDSKTAGVTLLNQSAVVTVGDFFTAPIELLPWYAARHPLSQPQPISAADIEQVYRYLIGKYLKPKPWITAAVERFAMEHFPGRRLQAVHVRGSDKVVEIPEIADLRDTIFQAVRADLAADRSLYIFLLTDDASLLEKYRSSFPDRIITTDCLRSGSGQGLHYSPSASRSQLGFEVLRDAFLAARCDRFIGIGSTNVSNFIMHLKAWPTGTLRLAGTVLQHTRSELIV